MIQETIDRLGTTVKDRVTGFEGVVSSVSFDLYGCVQAVITPVVKEGKLQDSNWFDVDRLEVVSLHHVMPVPKFAQEPTGPAEKPAR